MAGVGVPSFVVSGALGHWTVEAYPMQTISALSAPEDARVYVTAEKQGQPYDFGADTVQMAFKAAGVAPATGDWHTASWEQDITAAGGIAYWAVCPVGTGGAVLTAGTYVKWVQITDPSETVVAQAGQLTIY